MPAKLYQELCSFLLRCRIPPGMNQALIARAREQGITRSELVRRIFIKELKLNEKTAS